MLKVTNVKVQDDFSKLKPTIHIFPYREKLVENLTNRFSRPYTQYKQEVLPTVFKKLKWPANTKVRWDARYFCSCGCSPCFVVEDSRVEDHRFVSVTIKGL